MENIWTKETLMLLWREVAQEISRSHPHYYDLIKEFGYGFRVVNVPASYFGKCRHLERKVEVNLYLHKKSTKDMIIDTMRHEIAHAVDFCTRGTSDHSVHWKRLAKELGAIPLAKSKRAIGIDYKYVSVTFYEDGRVKRGRGYNKIPSGCKPNEIMKGYYNKLDPILSKNRMKLLPWDSWCSLAKARNLDIYD